MKKNITLLNTLAEIRDYVHERVDVIPQGICEDFNDLAKHLGASCAHSSWCLPVTHDSPTAKEEKKVMEVTKEEKIEELDKKIIALVEEYYNLVAPTEEELSNCGENLWDDRREACELLTDNTSALGKWYLAGDTLAYREMMAEEEEDADQS